MGFLLQLFGTTGEITLWPHFANFPGPNPGQPGEVIDFQFWFREFDLTAGFPTPNTTDGISVMFR